MTEIPTNFPSYIPLLSSSYVTAFYNHISGLQPAQGTDRAHHKRTRVYAPNYTIFKSADSLGKYVATINSPQLLSDFVILEYKQ